MAMIKGTPEYISRKGWKPLRSDRIHVYCPHCGRKMSNMPRADYDPPKAIVVAAVCDKCSMGCKIDGPDAYYGRNGRRLVWEL
jgi:hypothetical protein